MNKNRKIKFRAWDTKNKRWLARVPQWEYLLDEPDADVSHHDIDQESGLHIFPWRPLGNDYNGRVLFQQLTGLKDKTGKEVYEGDILSIPNGDPADCSGNFFVIVEYKYGGFGYTDTLNRKWDSLYSLLEEADVDDLAEVIGNIFENPELLK